MRVERGEWRDRGRVRRRKGKDKKTDPLPAKNKIPESFRDFTDLGLMLKKLILERLEIVLL